MNKMSKAVALGVVVMSIAACKNVAPETDQEAVIVNPDAASRAALQASLSESLHTDVALAEDAVTQTSVLIIEQKAPQSIEGSPAQGRNMQMPIQFRLVKNGAECVLVDQRDLSRSVLTDTECSAL